MNIKALLMGVALVSATALSANAEVAGTQGFIDGGSPTTNTGNINTATLFTIGDLLTSSANTGVFAHLPRFLDFGAVSFNTTSGSSLTFSNASFGSFTSTAIDVAATAPGTETFYVLGNWNPETSGLATAGSYAASFTIGFTQTPASTGTISDSATFSIPPAPAPAVPEISTWAMMLAGFGALGFAGYRRRNTIVA
jgi:hypothetical protein